MGVAGILASYGRGVGVSVGDETGTGGILERVPFSGGGLNCAAPPGLFIPGGFSISLLSASFGLVAARANWAWPSMLTSALIHGRSRDVFVGLHSKLSSSRRSSLRAYGSPSDFRRSSSDRRTSNVAVNWRGSPASYLAGCQTATRKTLDGLE